MTLGKIWEKIKENGGFNYGGKVFSISSLLLLDLGYVDGSLPSS
ncbi:Uncharacterized protein APZ42_006753 [Daphnia magna]|uniref:Uncharacterized protein n=1 Tax=Daphnia magna TaxID=35525 RepID=A0A164FQ81_9CRUS|nr:Uncharacterized protein APZ42_006753 [Daphnia magna]